MHHTGTIAARPLREEYKAHAAQERRLHFFLCGLCVRPPRAINIDCARQGRYPADAGPGFDFSFGHEHTSRDGAENQNVKVAQVVGDDQTSFRNFAVEMDLYAYG